MAYKVVKYFTDLQDGNYAYKVGDTFPRKGLKVLASRYKELATTNNRRHEILIEEVEDEKTETKVEETNE
jgi:hypothetical protein